MIKRFLYIILLIFFALYSMGQEVSIRGIITDATSGEPIPFVSIAIVELYKGTSSNINGEFLIKLDSLPVRLKFSHISYHQQEILIENEEYVNIQLTLGEIILDELIIEDEEKGEYANNLLLSALRKAVQHSRDWKYGLAYYRQTSQNGDDYSELYEIFYDTRYSSQGIVDWAIQEGRYAMEIGPNVLVYVYNKNFTLLTRLTSMYQPETDKFVMPVNENVRELYDVSIKDLKNIQGRKVATVAFIPKEEIYIPAMEGEILIDIESYEILKLHGYIRNDEFDLIALNNPKGSWENFELEIEAAYKSMDEGLFLDYITLTQNFDYYLEGEYRHHVKTNSFLTYYEYYQPDKFKRLGGRILRYNKSDRELIDKVGYNRRFWEENPIVLRTPIEEEIIESFEVKNAFGTIYLNDRDQVQLEKDDLDIDPFIQQINTDLRRSKIPSSGEKIYLHLDKPFYASGETIWFNAYEVNLATHIPSDESGVLYVDLISPGGEILMNKRLNINDSYADGNLEIPATYNTGTYRIRAYTNWMKNYDPDYFFDEPLNIYNSNEILNSKFSANEQALDYSIRFLPEGGHLISGIPAQVAFKAIDQHGKGIDVSGKIVDEQGVKLVEFETRHSGMGSFFFVPQIDKKYKAIVNYEGMKKTFELSQVKGIGYSLNVNNLRDKNIQIIVKSSPGLNDSEFYIIGQTRGILYHREKSKISTGNAIINIPKSKLPDGIFHITLFDNQHIPHCERLVFINHDQGINVNLETDNEIVRARDKIHLTFELTDQFDRAIRNTSFSVAVTDAGHLIKQQVSENILTNLLLSSDLKGNIQDPGYYFLSDDRETKIVLDLVMLTHGWRRFTWKEIFEDSLSDTPYSHENAINISGSVKMGNTKNPLKNGYVNFFSLNENFPGFWSAFTDVEGNFQLKNLIIPDTLRVIAKSLNDRGKPANINLNIQPIIPFETNQNDYQKYPPVIDADVIRYLNRFEEKEEVEASFDFSDRILLKEIKITGDRYRSNIYGEPDNVIQVDDNLRTYSDIFQIIQGRVPGVSVTGQGLNTSITIRGISTFSGNNQPLIVVDGIPISNIESFGSSLISGDSASAAGAADMMESDISNVNSLLLSISPHEVDRIEILKSGASAAAFGIRGANGVILIYTRRGGDVINNSQVQGYTDLRFPGYSFVREFYAPAYDVPKEEHIIPDKRTTIYWNPSVTTNNLGKAEIEFFNSDDARSLQIDIQGVTDWGDIIQMTQIIGADLVK